MLTMASDFMLNKLILNNNFVSWYKNYIQTKTMFYLNIFIK